MLEIVLAIQSVFILFGNSLEKALVTLTVSQSFQSLPIFDY